jgi:hypothetical protein
VKGHLLGEGIPGSGLKHQSLTLINLLHKAQCSLKND